MYTIEQVLQLARLALEHTATTDSHENAANEEAARYALDVYLEAMELANKQIEKVLNK